jgi:hypothetical protein
MLPIGIISIAVNRETGLSSASFVPCLLETSMTMQFRKKALATVVEFSIYGEDQPAMIGARCLRNLNTGSNFRRLFRNITGIISTLLDTFTELNDNQ